mgnify:CR=1 FL=1
MNDKEYIEGMHKARKRGAQKGNRNAKKDDPLTHKLSCGATKTEKETITRLCSLEGISESNYIRNKLGL